VTGCVNWHNDAFAWEAEKRYCYPAETSASANQRIPPMKQAESSALAAQRRIALLYLSEADQIAASTARKLQGLSGCERDDLQQEARLALFQAAARVKIGTDPLPFLRRSVAGALKHYLRDRVRMVRIPRRAHEAGWHSFGHVSLDASVGDAGNALLDLLPAPEPEPEAPRSALAAELARMVETLPAADAAALRLTVMQGQTLRDAAASLGLSPMAVSRRRDRAVDAIRYALGA